MTHADSLAIPSDVTTKPQFYAHVIDTLKGEFAGGTQPPSLRSLQGVISPLSELTWVADPQSLFRLFDLAAALSLLPLHRNRTRLRLRLVPALLAEAGPNDPVQQNWLSQLSNAAALLFGAFENLEAGWGRTPGRRCNWSGTLGLARQPVI